MPVATDPRPTIDRATTSTGANGATDPLRRRQGATGSIAPPNASGPPDDVVPTRTLVLGMAHPDGTIAASELYPVADACGFSAEQVRSCLRRLIAEGLLIRDGRGAAAQFRSTDAGMAALARTMERTRLAYSQDAAGKGWDRTWHLVAFAIPEGQRGARDTFRQVLLDLGGAAVQNGMYVSAHDWDAQVRSVAQRQGISEYLTIATTTELSIGPISEPRAIARRLWPIDDLAARYESFINKYSHVLDALASLRQRRERISDASFLQGAFAMAATLNECFLADPLLPPELLPRPWPGRTAREVAVRSRRLTVASLQSHHRPTLFRMFDEAIDSL